MDNDNGTASGQPCGNRRSAIQYNTQYNVTSSQWVSDQQALVANFFLDSALYGIFRMDSCIEIQGMLAYQALYNGTPTPVDTAIFKYKRIHTQMNLVL